MCMLMQAVHSLLTTACMFGNLHTRHLEKNHARFGQLLGEEPGRQALAFLIYPFSPSVGDHMSRLETGVFPNGPVFEL